MKVKVEAKSQSVMYFLCLINISGAYLSIKRFLLLLSWFCILLLIGTVLLQFKEPFLLSLVPW